MNRGAGVLALVALLDRDKAAIREKGRFDILLWRPDGTPRAPIEVKCQVTRYRQIESDVERVLAAIGRSRATSSIAFGAIAFFTAEADGKDFTAAERVSRYVKNVTQAVEESAGYPYYVQLVGFYAFDAAQACGDSVINESHLQEGLVEARQQFTQSILEVLPRQLSPLDQKFLLAMATDAVGQSSRTSVIAERIGQTIGSVSFYRDRLIKAGVIEPAGHGFVRFAITGHHAQLRTTEAFIAQTAQRLQLTRRPRQMRIVPGKQVQAADDDARV